MKLFFKLLWLFLCVWAMPNSWKFRRWFLGGCWTRIKDTDIKGTTAESKYLETGEHPGTWIHTSKPYYIAAHNRNKLVVVERDNYLSNETYDYNDND